MAGIFIKKNMLQLSVKLCKMEDILPRYSKGQDF